MKPGETLAEQQGALGAAMGQGAKKLAMNVDPQAAVPAKRSMMAAPYVESLSAAFRPAGVQGLDVSGWQADAATNSVSSVNWSRQWTLGARFVYAKASEGNNFADTSFSSQYTGASKAGMLRGAYHFALPGQSSAVSQADYFVNHGGGWSGDGKTLPPLLDIEYNPYSSLGNTCYNFSQSAMVTWIKDFSNRVKARTGRLPMIYTTTDWWITCTGNSAAFSNQPLHVAAYSTSLGALPKSWSVQSVWQYSSTGPFDGDSNAWNGTEASLKTFATKADAQVPQPPVVPANNPSIPSPANLVAADGSGALWNYPGTGSTGFGARKQIGRGWAGMRSITVIDWNSDGVLDLIAQRTDGSLSVYKGLPGGGFSAAQTLASGWGSSQLTIGYWLNSSKYPQIITRSATGDLKLWKNTSGSGIDTGTQIGQGWNSLNLTMIDFDGDGKQDLLAQDTSGTVRLYRSNGAGGFIGENRNVVGTGWNAFTSVSVYSDFAFSGSNGLIRRTAAGALSYLPVIGKSTFGSPSAIGGGWSPFLIAGGENINPPQKPLAPPAPKVVAGNGRAIVSVAKNASGAAATSFLVTASSGGSNCALAASSGTCTVTGLANGKSYTFGAVAKNAAGASPSSSASAPVVPTDPVSRVSGADRYAVSAAVSKATFAPGVSVAYIASGAVFPDALSGAAAAGKTGSPVLLAATNGITAEVDAELTRLKPKTIVVLGGTGTLTNNVQTALKKYSPSVTRIAGADRYAVSAAVSKATFAPGVSVAYIASGAVFPDALSGAAAAGKTGSPVLLAATNGITAEVDAELTRLKPKTIVVLGGTGTLTNNVQTALKKYSPSVTRIAGADRYAISAAVSKATFAPGVSVAYIASGAVFPDALSGAAAAGKTGSPVLLAATNGITAEVDAELTRLKPKTIVVLGGTGTLTNNVQAQLAKYAG